jgi:hypothetical protein
MPNPSELYRQELEAPPVFAADRFEVRATVLQTSRWHVVDKDRMGYVAAWCRDKQMADRIAELLNSYGG